MPAELLAAGPLPGVAGGLLTCPMQFSWQITAQLRIVLDNAAVRTATALSKYSNSSICGNLDSPLAGPRYVTVGSIRHSKWLLASASGWVMLR
ncbi:MAG TPA: hypothetical protein VFQ44_00825 [Streptosporangiaceae bacterium]|nr:hypothetical protein [Streptosporangiaceae bacterium]